METTEAGEETMARIESMDRDKITSKAKGDKISMKPTTGEGAEITRGVDSAIKGEVVKLYQYAHGASMESIRQPPVRRHKPVRRICKSWRARRGKQRMPKASSLFRRRVT